MHKPAALLPAVLLGLVAGLGGETLLFLERQFWGLEGWLREDFRVVLFLKAEPEEGRRRVLEEKLLALPHVADVLYLSPGDALARLRSEDPEFVEAIALVGENPLRAAFEASLEREAFPSLPDWLQRARDLEDWADLRYKPGQVQAVLQAQFYGHLAHLALSGMLCLLAAASLKLVWSALRRPRPLARPRARDGSLAGAAAAAAAAALGALAVAALAWPMRVHVPWWSWPEAGRQALLGLSAALGGWLLCPRGD